MYQFLAAALLSFNLLVAPQNTVHVIAGYTYKYPGFQTSIINFEVFEGNRLALFQPTLDNVFHQTELVPGNYDVRIYNAPYYCEGPLRLPLTDANKYVRATFSCKSEIWIPSVSK